MTPELREAVERVAAEADRIAASAILMCGPDWRITLVADARQVDGLRTILAALRPHEGGEAVAWLKEWNSVGNARTGMRRVDLTPACEPWLDNMYPIVTPL